MLTVTTVVVLYHEHNQMAKLSKPHKFMSFLVFQLYLSEAV